MRSSNFASNMDGKRKRTELKIEQKREICLYKERNPSASQEEIARHFNREWDTGMSRRMIGDILTQKNKWTVEKCVVGGARSEPKRMRNAENVELEKALFLWFTQMRCKHAVLTDAILTEKARYFGDLLGVKDFKYSTGWLANFKSRYGISMRAICGESEGVDPVTVVVGRYEMRQILSQYSENDIFNCDESALFYRAPPGKTLSAGPARGTKRNKDRVTLMFCCNANGTEKRKVLVIGKSKQPRCFKSFNVQVYVDYVSSRKAWMNSALFISFLSKLNSDMILQDRKILLLLDNASSHPTDVELSNVKLCFLPPNTTSHLQPLDSGIIKCFKSHYRKLQLQHIVQMMDANSEPDLNLKQAVCFIRAAWQNVSPNVIKNCWAHAGLIDKDISEKDTSVFTLTPTSHIQTILVKLSTALTATAYIDLDAVEPTEKEMSDEEIVQAVLCEVDNSGEEEEYEKDENLVPAPSLNEAQQALTVVLRYFQSNSHASAEDIDKLADIDKLLKDVATSNLCQTKITSFFNKL